MKVTMKVLMNLKIKQGQAKVKKARDRGLRDVVVAIANDAIKGSPRKWGTNMRSIKYEVGPGGEIAKKEGTGAVYTPCGSGG